MLNECQQAPFYKTNEKIGRWTFRWKSFINPKRHHSWEHWSIPLYDIQYFLLNALNDKWYSWYDSFTIQCLLFIPHVKHLLTMTISSQVHYIPL